MEPSNVQPRSATNSPTGTGHTPLAVEVRPAEDVTLVAVSGDLDAYSVPELRSVLTRVIDATESVIVEVDLSQVTFIDAGGIALLVGQQRRLNSLGRELMLSGLSHGVERVLKVTGLSRAFTLRRLPTEAVSKAPTAGVMHG